MKKIILGTALALSTLLAGESMAMHVKGESKKQHEVIRIEGKENPRVPDFSDRPRDAGEELASFGGPDSYSTPF